MNAETKQCTKCNEIKLINEFCKKRNKCILCIKKRSGNLL